MFMKKNRQSKTKYELYVSLIIVITVFLLTVGFAAFQNQIAINNTMATVNSSGDVRITNIVSTSVTNNGVAVSETYNLTHLEASFDLPDADSTVTYTIDVTNLSNSMVAISDVLNLPENLTYTITGYDLNHLLCDDNDSNKCTLGAKNQMSITIGYAPDGYDGVETSYYVDMELEIVNLDSAIAMVGTNLYSSLQTAINAVANNTQGTVILLKSTSECVTVSRYRNIIFDFKNNTLSNNAEAAVITNHGTISISNGILTSDALLNATINNESTGRATVSGGYIINTGDRQAIYNNAGVLIITGTAYLTNSTNQRGAIQNQSGGNITIYSGTIIGERLYGISNAGTLVIGIQDGTPDRAAPVIQGLVDGVNATTNFSFYDGIIKARELPINPPTRVTSRETGYIIVSGEETIDGVLYRTAYNGVGVTVTFNANSGTVNEASRNVEVGSRVGVLPVPSRSGYSFDGWYTAQTGGTLIDENTIITVATPFWAHWTKIGEVILNVNTGVMYDSLEDAVAAIPDNTPTELELKKNTSTDLNIPSTKTITINLNGYTVNNVGSRPIIETAGNLTLKNGDLSSDANQGAINNTAGNLLIENVSIVCSGNRQAVYITGGEVTISGSSYLESATSGKPSGSSMERGTVHVVSGTVNIYGGTIVATASHAVSNQGTCNLGRKDGVIDSTIPELRGKSNGIKSTGTLNFYDGIAMGGTSAINGTVSDHETGASQKTGTQKIGKTNYKTVTYQF